MKIEYLSQNLLKLNFRTISKMVTILQKNFHNKI